MTRHKPIPKSKRLLVYEKCNHRCAYCGCELEYKDMQVDHIKSVYTHTDMSNKMTEDEINDVSNLLPSCRQCNFYKSTMTIEEFRHRLTDTMWERLKENFGYRLALKYRLIEENPHDIKFYYELRAE